MSPVAHQTRTYPIFCSMKRQSISTPTGWKAVYRRVTPSIKFPGTHLYTWEEKGTVRVKSLAQEYNTMSGQARVQTQTAHSGVECTNHEATMPPTASKKNLLLIIVCQIV